MTHPDFTTWTKENLVKFAEEAYQRIIDDTYEIAELKHRLENQDEKNH